MCRALKPCCVTGWRPNRVWLRSSTPWLCDSKTLRSSITENDSGATRFIAQVSLYSQTLGVEIAQTTYATDASGETQARRLLLEAVELEGVLVQADALHANRPFSSTSPRAVPTS